VGRSRECSHGGRLFGQERSRDENRAIANREPHGDAYVRHFLTNVVIEPAPDGTATGEQYLAVIDVSESGSPSAIFLDGRYEDTYRRTPEGWRFRSRGLARADAPPPTR
jgi:hypothetical protein